MRIIFTHNLSFLVMDVPDVKNEIKKIFLGVFSEINDFEFNWDTHFTEYENWDSFMHLTLVSKIEKKFNIQFDFDDSINLSSAADFIKLTHKMLNSS
tara:strand:+ start:683 stop:973 length:291 start_codon:yes stop_codon:yes gene_type:complete